MTRVRRLRMDDRGSLPMALLIVLIGVALAGLLVPVAISQNGVTRFDDRRASSLQSAEAGVDVALGVVKSASDSSGTGVVTKLPCGPFSGAVASTVGGDYNGLDRLLQFRSTRTERHLACREQDDLRGRLRRTQSRGRGRQLHPELRRLHLVGDGRNLVDGQDAAGHLRGADHQHEHLRRCDPGVASHQRHHAVLHGRRDEPHAQYPGDSDGMPDRQRPDSRRPVVVLQHRSQHPVGVHGRQHHAEPQWERPLHRDHKCRQPHRRQGDNVAEMRRCRLRDLGLEVEHRRAAPISKARSTTSPTSMATASTRVQATARPRRTSGMLDAANLPRRRSRSFTDLDPGAQRRRRGSGIGGFAAIGELLPVRPVPGRDESECGDHR